MLKGLAFSALPHVSGKERTRPQRLGDDEPIARTHAALAQAVLRIDEAIDGKTQRQFRAFTGVPTHEHGAGLVQHLLCPQQHLGQQVFDFRFYPIGHRGNGQGRLRSAPMAKISPRL